MAQNLTKTQREVMEVSLKGLKQRAKPASIRTASMFDGVENVLVDVHEANPSFIPEGRVHVPSKTAINVRLVIKLNLYQVTQMPKTHTQCFSSPIN